MTIQVAEGIYFDADDLAARLRPIDKLEARAVSGQEPAACLRYGTQYSTRWWTIILDGVPHGAFGVAPVPCVSGLGAPWFMSSSEVFQGEALRRFVTEAPSYLKRMCEGYDYLSNFVCEHNRKSIRFLKRIGFTLHTETHYFKQYPFLEFSLCVTPSLLEPSLSPAVSDKSAPQTARPVLSLTPRPRSIRPTEPRS